MSVGGGMGWKTGFHVVGSPPRTAGRQCAHAFPCVSSPSSTHPLGAIMRMNAMGLDGRSLF